MIDMETKKSAYVCHGSNTPPLAEQLKALADEGFKPDDIFVDAAPCRENRNDLIRYGLEPGDTLVLAAPQIIGKGKKDTAEAVRKICVDRGTMIQIAGFKPAMYQTDDQIAGFTKDAISESLRTNGKNTAARRSRSGPKAKLDDVAPGDWDRIKWLYLRDDVRQSVAVDYCNRFCGTEGVTRVNIFQRIQRDLKE